MEPEHIVEINSKLEEVRQICFKNNIDYVAVYQSGKIIFNLPRYIYGLSVLINHIVGLLIHIQTPASKDTFVMHPTLDKRQNN